MYNTFDNTENLYLVSDSEADEIESEIITKSEVQDTDKFLKARYVLGILGFLGFANVYAMRVNLSVAIVAMVNNTAIPKPPNVTLDICHSTDGNSTVPLPDGPFAWDEETQGIVLGSFFYGYVLTQIPGGRLAEKYGGKTIFGLGVLFTAIFTLISPLAATFNFEAFILIRILEGLAEGVTFPSMHAMLARWIPPLERNKFAALVYTGANLGTIISLPVSGYLCSIAFDGGWPLSFYLFGILGIIWWFFWVTLAFDKPTTHPYIDRREKLYILSTTGLRDDDTANEIPWCKILTCMPLWAILVTQCGQAWGFYTQLTEFPIYMSNVLHYNIQQNAIISALPYVSSLVTGFLFSLLADSMIDKGIISPLTSYKLFNTIATIFPSLGFIAIAWAGCNRHLVELILLFSSAFAGAGYSGYQMNHIALSPKFAGTMYGITNAAGNICGFLAPLIVGLLTEGQETLSRWRLIFYLTAGVNIGTNLFYVVFASAKEQTWSQVEPIDLSRVFNEDNDDDNDNHDDNNMSEGNSV